MANVTGAGSIAPGIGNGRAAAVLFAREGAKVLLLDQNPSAAEETRDMIRKEGGTAEIFTGDVTRADDAWQEEHGPTHHIWRAGRAGDVGPRGARLHTLADEDAVKAAVASLRENDEETYTAYEGEMP